MGVLCQIHVERPPEGVYRPGHPVSGVIKYAVDEDTAFKDITVSLHGKGDCNWSQTTGEVHIAYFGHEDYVNVSASILNNKTDEEMLVKKGVYSHPFRFELPANVPPSYKDDYCLISYCIKLMFTRKGLFNFDKVFQTKIPVISYVDVTSPREPLICGERKSLPGLMRREDDCIDVKVMTKNPSLAPGDAAELHIDVKNNSSTTVTTLETQLIQEIKYVASCGTTNYNFSKIKGARAETTSVPERTTANFIHAIRIPEGLFSIQSKVLLKEYKFRIKVKLPFPYNSFIISVPLNVGEAGAEKAKCAKAEYTFDPETLLKDLPPSYWEVMQEDKDMESKKEFDKRK